MPLYWVLNLVDNRLDVFSKPHPQQRRYEEEAILTAKDHAAVMIEDRKLGEVAVADLLPQTR